MQEYVDLDVFFFLAWYSLQFPLQPADVALRLLFRSFAIAIFIDIQRRRIERFGSLL